MQEEKVSRRDMIAKVAGMAVLASPLMAALPAEAAQVHMQNAMRALNNALSQLQAAEHDKGGHREQAIQLVQQAIAQVQEGIQAGR